MGSLCSKRYNVSNCEKDPEKQGENDVTYIQTTYTKYREDDPIYNDTKENSKEEQGYFSGSDVSSDSLEADTPGNGKNMGSENQDNEKKEDLKIGNGSFLKVEESRERKNSYNNGGFIDEEDEVGIEYMTEKEIGKMNDFNYRAENLFSKDVKKSHNSFHNEGFISETDQMDEVDECLTKNKPKEDTGNSYKKGGLIDKTDEMDDCIVQKAFVGFPHDLGERQEKIEIEITPTQSTMYNANNVLINSLEEKAEVDQIGKNENHPTTSEFKNLHSENLEAEIEKVKPENTITITQSTIFISANDITNDHEKIEEMKEKHTIHKVSQFQSDHSENIKDISSNDNITSQSTIYKSGDLFIENSEEKDGLPQSVDINTQSFIYKAGDISVMNDLDEEIEGMTEPEPMNETENPYHLNDIVTLPTMYKGEVDEVNNLDNIFSKSTIYKSGVEISSIDNITLQSTVYKSADLSIEASEEKDGLPEPVDINKKSIIYKAGDIFVNDLDEGIEGKTEPFNFAMNENMDQLNYIVTLPTVYKEEADEINNLDNIYSKSTLYKSGEEIINYSEKTNENTDIENMHTDKSKSKEDEIRIKTTVYKAGDIFMNDLTQEEKITDHCNIVSQSTVNKAGQIFTLDYIQTENMFHTQDVTTEAVEETCQFDDIAANFATYGKETKDNENIVSQSTIYKAGRIFYDKSEGTKDTDISTQNTTYTAEDTLLDHPEDPEEMTEREKNSHNDFVMQSTIYKSGDISNDHDKEINEISKTNNIVVHSTIYKAGDTCNDNFTKINDMNLDEYIIEEETPFNEHFTQSYINKNDYSEEVEGSTKLSQSTLYKAGENFTCDPEEIEEISHTDDIITKTNTYKAGEISSDIPQDTQEKAKFDQLVTNNKNQEDFIETNNTYDSEEVEESTKFENILSQSTLYKAGENFTCDPKEKEEISHFDDIITKTNTYKAGDISTDITQDTQEKAEFDPLVTIYKNPKDFIEPENIFRNLTYNPEESDENNQNDKLPKYTLYESEDFKDNYIENIDVEQMDEYNNGYSRIQENIYHNIQIKKSIYKAGEVSAKLETPERIPDIKILTQSMKFKGGEIYRDDLEETYNGMGRESDLNQEDVLEERIIGKEDSFANKLFSICKEKNEEDIPEDDLLHDDVQSSPHKSQSYKVSRQIWLMQ